MLERICILIDQIALLVMLEVLVAIGCGRQCLRATMVMTNGVWVGRYCLVGWLPLIVALDMWLGIGYGFYRKATMLALLHGV